MFVTDLHHFLDLPAGTPGPARRLAEHLSNIVRAATAGDAGTAWESALPCRRRPANRRCPGRMIVLRTDPPAPIRWQCSVCGDGGVISNWAGLALRSAQATAHPHRPRQRTCHPERGGRGAARTAIARCRLRTSGVPDPSHNDRAVLPATDGDLDELIGFVAAEANHESSLRRQQRLDTAFDALSNAAQATDGR